MLRALSDLPQPNPVVAAETASIAVAEPSAPLDLIAPLVTEPVAPVVEAPAEPVLKHHSETPTILGAAEFKGADPKAVEPVPPVAATEAKPADLAAADPNAKPAAAVVEPVEPAKPEPIVYDFKVPVDIRAEPEALAQASKVFNELGLDQAKASVALDAYYAELRAQQARTAQAQNDAFMDMRKGWQDRIKADPLLSKPEVMKTIIRMRDAVVPESDLADFNEMLGLTGAGDHPAQARLLYRFHEHMTAEIAKALAPYQEARAPSPNIRPSPNAGQDPSLRGARALYEPEPGRAP